MALRGLNLRRLCTGSTELGKWELYYDPFDCELCVKLGTQSLFFGYFTAQCVRLSDTPLLRGRGWVAE